MEQDLRSFWNRIQSGIEVAVASQASPELLGTRDGFLRYLRQPRDRSRPVVVVPHPTGGVSAGLSTTDERTLEFAVSRAQSLRAELGDTYHFYVAIEGGIHSMEIAEETRYFIRSWAVVTGALGEAWGSSGSVEIPGNLVAGLDDLQVPHAVPGTRRRGGMIASLTRGQETRRGAVGTSVFHAISTLFYGVLDQPL